MSGERYAVKVRVIGRVQGVYFRGWTKEQAEILGLDGWVRNEHDGSVAALIAGAPAAVEEMLKRMREGPLDAQVIGITVEKVDPAQAPRGFDILR